MQRVRLAHDHEISRVIRGGWQMAGGHGGIDSAAAIEDMMAFADAGITTFDCADIYTGVEALIGTYLARVRARGGDSGPARLQIHTKCVPDLNRLPELTRREIEAMVDRSRERLGVDALDLVQLHWWNYESPNMVETAHWLDDLRRAGKVRNLGLTNCDTAHVERILDAGVRVISHQVQYSVLDRRPSGAMAALCSGRGIGLIAYGALAGGFLSERWLDAPAPREPLENRSLVKYRLIIEECGGWGYFQSLLAAMKQVADKHGVTIGAVAIRWVLDQPGVAAVIVGARHPHHLVSTLAAPSVALDAGDVARIAAVQASALGPSGEVYGLERVAGGRHAAIMRYDLQRT